MVSTQEEGYGDTLREVGENLGRADVKKIASYLKNANKIKKNKYDEICVDKDPFQELCNVLADVNLLSKDNVQELLIILEKNHLITAAKPLRKYQEKWLMQTDGPLNLPNVPRASPGSRDGCMEMDES